MTQAPHTQLQGMTDRLGPRQIKTILSLDREWGKAFCHRTAKAFFYSKLPALVQHKSQSGNMWRLTANGMLVRAMLIGRGHTL